MDPAGLNKNLNNWSSTCDPCQPLMTFNGFVHHIVMFNNQDESYCINNLTSQTIMASSKLACKLIMQLIPKERLLLLLTDVFSQSSTPHWLNLDHHQADP
jgi:hypothetical protein